MPRNRDLSVVVTGSSGYVGKRLVDDLRNQGYEVIEIDNGHPSNPIDLRNISELRQVQLPSKYLLVHLAFPLPGRVNATEFKRLANSINSNLVAVLNPIDTLFISSTAVYALDGAGSRNVSPWEIYGQLKMESEVFFTKSFANLTIFRPGTLVDADRDSMMMKFLKQIKNSRFPILPGNGKIIHPFTFTGDLIQAITHWVEEGTANEKIFDLVASNPLPLSDLCNLDRKSKKLFSIRVPLKLLRIIGSDKFPVFQISKWHFSALTYNFVRGTPNIYNRDFLDYKNILKF